MSESLQYVMQHAVNLLVDYDERHPDASPEDLVRHLQRGLFYTIVGAPS